MPYLFILSLDHDFRMDLGQQFIIFITATFAAIVTAAIPSAGLVTMLIVLAVIGLLLAVDWFLDRVPTTVNVWGECVGAAVLERIPPEKAI